MEFPCSEAAALLLRGHRPGRLGDLAGVNAVLVHSMSRDLRVPTVRAARDDKSATVSGSRRMPGSRVWFAVVGARTRKGQGRGETRRAIGDPDRLGHRHDILRAELAGEDHDVF